MVDKLKNLMKSRFWDVSNDIVLTKRFGVVSGIALLMVKAFQGKEELRVSCSDTLALADVKELLEAISKYKFTVGETKIEKGFPVAIVKVTKVG
jgi:hypothetical protein